MPLSLIALLYGSADFMAFWTWFRVPAMMMGRAMPRRVCSMAVLLLFASCTWRAERGGRGVRRRPCGYIEVPLLGRGGVSNQKFPQHFLALDDAELALLLLPITDQEKDEEEQDPRVDGGILQGLPEVRRPLATCNGPLTSEAELKRRRLT